MIMAKHIYVTGVIQGVGFHPFVYGLATRLELHDWVCNTSGAWKLLFKVKHQMTWNLLK
jgi:hydrogenase maturation factor HypF (carbamoyltransferase family)